MKYNSIGTSSRDYLTLKQIQMSILITYYIIGFVVTSYFIKYYRFSKNHPRPVKKYDSIGGLLGPWIWPLQIIIHIKDEFKIKF